MKILLNLRRMVNKICNTIGGIFHGGLQIYLHIHKSSHLLGGVGQCGEGRGNGNGWGDWGTRYCLVLIKKIYQDFSYLN